ncbi:MAG: cytochrome c-type biogenesis protein CcmH [Pseudomonadales bacterium]|jgi:cytochrome c-type biogenesis protein CcmH|nr:cytochrome c-type biogenesis protein CcmH [Pseudomonadales bacterium]
MHKIAILLTAALMLGCLTFGHHTRAAIDAYAFPDETLRDRYNGLIDELRCPQCLNTNLAGSDAMVAKDLRREVHRLVLEGKSDEQVLDFMYERYGDFILYEPRFKPGTWLLWLGPIALLFLAIFFGIRFSRRSSQVSDLTEDEDRKIDQLLKSQESSTDK